jgi:hypothetical protein
MGTVVRSLVSAWAEVGARGKRGACRPCVNRLGSPQSRRDSEKRGGGGRRREPKVVLAQYELV